MIDDELERLIKKNIKSSEVKSILNKTNRKMGLAEIELIKLADEQRKQVNTPAENFPLNHEELMAISRTPSYINEFLKFTFSIIKQKKEIKEEGGTDIQEPVLMPYIAPRARAIFYTIKNKEPLFMLNQKKSSRGYNFYELSLKGGIEIDDKGVSAAIYREIQEEIPGINDIMLKYGQGTRGKYYNWKDPQIRNSDLLKIKEANKFYKAERLDIIVTELRKFKEPFLPLFKEEDEHDHSLWLPLDDAQMVLKQDAEKYGMDRDYLLSASLLPQIPFNDENFFKSFEQEIIGNYIKFP